MYLKESNKRFHSNNMKTQKDAILYQTTTNVVTSFMVEGQKA